MPFVASLRKRQAAGFDGIIDPAGFAITIPSATLSLAGPGACEPDVKRSCTPSLPATFAAAAGVYRVLNGLPSFAVVRTIGVALVSQHWEFLDFSGFVESSEVQHLLSAGLVSLNVPLDQGKTSVVGFLLLCTRT